MMYAFRFALIASFMLNLALHAKIYRPIPYGNTDNISGLVYCVNQAISTPEDDIIDLGGAIYNLDGSNFFFDINGGLNGLPIIPAGSGKLSIITGTLKRSPLIATPLFRFLYIEAGASVLLYNITMENGHSFIPDRASELHDNTEQEAILATGQDGGALYNLGTLNLRNVFLVNNYADGIGGALYNNGIITEIHNSIFSSNQSNTFNSFEGGGALYNDNSGLIMTINNTTISNNRSNNSNGGGIHNRGIIQNIANSALANNFAYQNGGSIYNSTTEVKSTLGITVEIARISNTTIYGNIASAGAGIFNESLIDALSNSTISGNGSGGTAIGGGIYNDVQGTVINLISNIIASNSAEIGQDLFNSGNIINQYYNLISSTSGNSIVDGINNNIVTGTPFLGSFQDNGGPTFTIALLPGSLAINNGNNPDALSYDQRGFPHHRTICGVTDIGAYERDGCH